MCAGKLRVMRVASYCELRVVHFSLTSLNFYRLAWMPSDALENTNLVEQRVNGTNGTNRKIDK